MKKVTISVSNKELDALEDVIVRDYLGDAKQESIDRQKALNIWQRLCKAYDKKP